MLLVSEENPANTMCSGNDSKPMCLTLVFFVYVYVSIEVVQRGESCIEGVGFLK